MTAILITCSLITVLSLLCPIFSARVLQPIKHNGIGNQEIEIEYLYVYADIRFRYARTRIMSQIHNHGQTSNQAKFWITIPRDAFITDFIIEVNGIRQIGIAVPKIMAQKWYCGLKSVEEMIGVVKQAKEVPRGLNKYELNVNIKPNQRINLTLAYEGQVDRIPGGGGNTEYSMNIQAMPENMHAVKKFRIVTEIEGGKPYFRIPSMITKNKTLIQPKMVVTPNSELVWAPNSSEIEELINEGLLGKAVIEYGVTTTDPRNHVLMVRDGYLIDRDKSNLKRDMHSTVPKHVVFVLDVSSSMYGKRLAQLKAGMKEIFDSMGNTSNYIDIVAFSNNITNWNPLEPGKDVADLQGLIYSSPDNKNYAMSFINNLRANGPTDIFSALRAGLKLAKRARERTDDNGNPYPSTMIFFVTDGEPTSGLVGHAAILRRLKNLNQQLSVPIYSLAFGSEADYELCKQISIQSGGLARKIFDNGDAAMRFQEFYNETISESLQNVTFNYVSPSSNLTKITHETFPLQPVNKKRKQGISVFSVPAAIVFDSTVMDLPCAEKCFMEKLHAFIRISRIYNSIETKLTEAVDVCQANRAVRRNPDYSEAIELASKYEFVTSCSSLVVVSPESKKFNEKMVQTEECD